MSATTVGIIYPGHAVEDEYATGAALLGVHLPVVHVYGTDLHAVPELLELGAPHRLAQAAAELSEHRPDAVMWACTSGSFVHGPAGVARQAAELTRVAGVPASSTTVAFVAALAELGVTRVAVAATYPGDVAALFTQHLTSAGLAVVGSSAAGISTAAEVATLNEEDVLDLALREDHPAAEALLVPDTALRTLPALPELERRLGKPVLTANQVTIWHGLRLAGVRPSSTVLGTLFTERQAHDHQ